MKLIQSESSCRQCGAPLRVSEHQRLVICAFCNATMRAEAVAGQPVPEAVAPMPPEVVERIKRLVLDGKRDAAIELCASTSGIPRDEARKSVDQMLLPSMSQHMQHLPINAFGFLLGFAIIGGGAALAWHGITLVLGEQWSGLAFAIPGVLLSLVGVRFLGPKAIATWFAAYGRTGRAVVRRRTTLAENIAGDGVLLLVLFEVTDERGAAFVDQEAVLVRAERVERLTPGNIIQVRMNWARTRVYPISPMDVIGRA